MLKPERRPEATHQAPERAAGDHRLVWLIAGLTLLGAALRAVHLDSTIGFDEAVNVRRFLQGGPPSILALHSGYGSTNNHLLNSLLAYASVRTFGLEVWALRLPSFLFAVLSLPLAGWLTLRLTRDRLAAVVATLLAALSPMLVAYSAACRGYGALLFFTLSSALLLLYSFEGKRATLPALVLALMGVGLSHMSGLVFVASCCALASCFLARGLWLRKRERAAAPWAPAAWTLVACTVAFIGLVAWYSRGASILGDVEHRIVHGEFVDPSLAGLRSVRGPGFLAWCALVGKEFFGTSAPWLLVCLPVALAGLISLARTRPHAGWALGILIVLPPIALLIGRLMPTPRYFLFVQPFVLIASAYGLVRIARHAPGIRMAAAVLALGFSALSWPRLERDLTGPGAELMGILWDIDSAVDYVARHAEPGDLVLSFPRPKVRGPWNEWSFWQSYQFHEDLRLAPLLRSESGVRDQIRIWYVTPRAEASETHLFPTGFEPERVARFAGCSIFMGKVGAPALGASIAIDFDLGSDDLGGWTWYDPFAGATLRIDQGVSIRADRSGAVGELRSPRIQVVPGRVLEISVRARAQQSSGLRPFAHLGANFHDASGEPVANTLLRAARGSTVPPSDAPFTIRIRTVVPRDARYLEVALGLADGTHDADVITFESPALRTE